MFQVISLLLALVVSTQSETTSTPAANLSPTMVQKPASTKIEVPQLLGDAFVVADPAALLKTLHDTQQRAWEDVKTVKVRAWYGFHNNKSPNPVTWLVTYTRSESPLQTKELKFHSNKVMLERKAGRTYQPVGVRADDSDAWYCLNGTLARPDMTVFAMFTKHMRPDGMEMLTIFPAEQKRSSLIEWESRQFGFVMPPKKFYGEKLPSVVKAGGELVVRRKGNIVELDMIDPKNRRTPRTIYRFDLSKDASAIVAYNRSRRRDAEFEKVDGRWLPSQVREQSLQRYSELNFFDWSVNAVLDPNEFSIKTLPVSDHTTVSDKRVSPPTRTAFRELED